MNPSTMVGEAVMAEMSLMQAVAREIAPEALRVVNRVIGPDGKPQLVARALTHEQAEHIQAGYEALREQASFGF